jgi:hypothetical protein
MTPHEAKYERLAQAFGIEKLKALVPFSVERIRAALASGDEHLNTLSLASWDRQHGGIAKPERCSCCKQWKPVEKESCVIALYAAARRNGMPMESGGWSLANSVCVLKHVAKFHLTTKGE